MTTRNVHAQLSALAAERCTTHHPHSKAAMRQCRKALRQISRCAASIGENVRQPASPLLPQPLGPVGPPKGGLTSDQ
eukprot:CAMPEP_0206147692 /NCGR_PEP_ID=MMETSP1473-20131121/34235_1 /ASSEMBLY_ACC=CAM_ASM_001109 /TAXON_ID=1461547 /ORGANISM="Stichococcus sp, Strain RCC1054" /LENGTH=76 /DNA_ID=CAMNT_0053544739 /DNA_START=463 /DNA_END=690 /DNA_ORIENTATION=+